MVNKQQTWTYQEVYENVCKMAILLKKHGVKKGDRVIIYLPMIPEAVNLHDGTARHGGIHSIVFGGLRRPSNFR
ncbi:UNVERIFIED_CONTAM: hypothetical protein GTU68_025182 [Idotea baltica]|nr:hypothetical protein [Idotea baltica]